MCESYSGSLFLDAAVLDCVLTALTSQSSSDASLFAQSKFEKYGIGPTVGPSLTEVPVTQSGESPHDTLSALLIS